MSALSLMIDLAPELEESRMETFISIAGSIISPDFESSKIDLATAYLAAHLMTLSERKGIAGSISQMSEGQLSVSFSNSPSFSNKADLTSLNSTVYGQQYLSIVRNVFGTAMRTGYMPNV